MAIINVSYRLPVTVGKTVRKAAGGLLTTLDHAEAGSHLQWVGWPGKVLTDGRRRHHVTRELEEKFGYTPVFLTRPELDGFYYGFSNASLWPVLHYMGQYLRYNQKWWRDYKTVNRRFADKVLQTISEGDTVWVHDYQLMLLPDILRSLRPDLRIAFFLHTPFPSYEVFRALPHREDLVQGLLGADQVGFHTYSYLRHFRSTVLRLLGYDTEMDHIIHENRRTYIGVYPIGIDAERFARELQRKRHAERKKELRKIHRQKTIVLSVERLDYSKGICRRLEAIDQFLTHCHDKRNIVFLFISIPSRVRVSEYQQLRERIESQIGQINGRHATVENVPIHFVFRSIKFSELCALYAIADVALVTPLIDGMNLVAKEYVACKETENGVLILSEFAGAAEELFNAVTVNPFNVADMAEKIEQALNMPEGEKSARMQQMREHVLHYDAPYWARRFLNDLHTHELPESSATMQAQDVTEEIAERFVEAHKVGCFIDYDGTLREFEQHPRHATPMPELCELLNALAENPRIDVFLISGRKHEELFEWFGALDIWLIAEHGLFLCEPGGDWVPLHENVDLSWKELVIDIFKHYEGSTPGTTVEEKRASVVWHYRSADPEFGEWKARHLLLSLHEMVGSLPVEIHHGNHIVEVVSVHVNKEAAVEEVLKERKYNLVVCAGDDITDESMLRHTSAHRFGIKIGSGNTEARYRVPSPGDLRNLLEEVENKMRT